MLKWAKQQLADVAGTEEPIYGAQAIHTVTDQAATTPSTTLQRDDLRWTILDHTCVETQTFYITTDSGHTATVQIIYNNVAGLKVTTQLTTKISYSDCDKPHLWSSDQLSNCSYNDTKHNFKADGCSVNLSEDGTTYHISSTVNKHSVVDLDFCQAGPGFMVGKNGTTTYGLDPQKPKGFMKHAFWPRCRVQGKIITPSGPVDMTGQGLFIFALQGMKPHHAAARWNFVNFQSPTYSAVMMELTTPPSYGSTVVNVAGVVTDDTILYAGATNTARHLATTHDDQNGWQVPTSAEFIFHSGSDDDDDQKFNAVLRGDLGPCIDKVDVMAEVPGFVKTIVAAAAGTKPYIYQFCPKIPLKLTIDGKEITEQGRLFTEAVFIS